MPGGAAHGMYYYCTVVTRSQQGVTRPGNLHTKQGVDATNRRRLPSRQALYLYIWATTLGTLAETNSSPTPTIYMGNDPWNACGDRPFTYTDGTGLRLYTSSTTYLLGWSCWRRLCPPPPPSQTPPSSQSPPLNSTPPRKRLLPWRLPGPPPWWRGGDFGSSSPGGFHEGGGFRGDAEFNGGDRDGGNFWHK